MSRSGGVYRENEVMLAAALLHVIGKITGVVQDLTNVKVNIESSSEEQFAKICLDKAVTKEEYDVLKPQIEEMDMLFDWDPDDGSRLFVTLWWVNLP